MPFVDRREVLDESTSNPATVAAEAHRLYESESFEADVLEALGPILKRHLDCEAVDQAAEDVLAEWFYRDGTGGLFQLRNELVTNHEADLQERDVVHMRSRRAEDRRIHYVVRRADPGATGVDVYRVDPDDGTMRPTDLSAGFVKYCERFDVSRMFRASEKRPFQIAQQLASEISAAADEAGVDVATETS